VIHLHPMDRVFIIIIIYKRMMHRTLFYVHKHFFVDMIHDIVMVSYVCTCDLCMHGCMDAHYFYMKCWAMMFIMDECIYYGMMHAFNDML